MQAFVCIDARDWETVIRGAARHLREGEAVLAHVVDERAPRGYELAIRGLLDHRNRRSEEEMTPVSETAAEELLVDAEVLLRQLCPELAVKKQIEAQGRWRGRQLHAYSITDLATGTSVEAHELPGEGPGEMPLGHTARFVVDHALCDVVILRL